MIYSINQSNLESLFLESNGNKTLVKEIFSRKCCKTSSLIRLAQKYNGFYVGNSREVCKLAERHNPNLKAVSINQLIRSYRFEGLEFGTPLFVDEIDYENIERLKVLSPHLRIFGFVNKQPIGSFHEILFTEQFLGDTESQFSMNNKQMITDFYKQDKFIFDQWKRSRKF